MSFVMLDEGSFPQDFARIEGLSVPHIINSIYKSRETGILHFIRGDVKKSLYIKQGNIIFAASSDRDDRLGDILIRDGKITYRELEEAQPKFVEGRRLGAILADESSLKPEDLVAAIIEQVKNIVFGIFNWNSGYYKFVNGELPTNELITLDLSTPEIIFQGVKQIRDFKTLLKGIGSLKKRFVLDFTIDDMMTAVMDEHEKNIIEALKNPASVEDVQEQTGLDTMSVVKFFAALRILGIIAEEPSPILRAFYKGGLFRGNLEDTSVIDIMGQLARSRQNGALYIDAELLQAGLLLKDGRITSLYMPDEKRSFLCFLILKGGAEQSRYLKMLLQNSEDESEYMSAIESEFSEEDLQPYEDEFAQQRLTEIVQLKEGEFIFRAERELPAPGISLDIPLERFIMDYITSIDNWVRVKKGCGELDTVLRITPAYLDIMDRIEVNKELWDVISMLENPLSVGEILSATEMKEFQMCRILWALQTIGILSRVDEGESAANTRAMTALADASQHTEDKRARSGEPEQESHSQGWDAERADAAAVEEKDGEVESSSREPSHGEVAQAEGVQEETAPAEIAKDEGSGETIQEEPEEEKIPIDDAILKEIRKFNEKQKYIFDKVKTELGAGARNFINYCKSRMGDDLKNPFIDLTIDTSGEWVPEELGKRIILDGIDDYRSGFDDFISLQVEMVGDLISKAKQEDLGRGIKEIEKRQIEID